jgi:hypothetical protein
LNALLVLLLCSGCGRIAFDSVSLTASDASTDAPIDAIETRQVTTTITVDNAYSFSWRVNSVHGYQFGANSPDTASIFACPLGVGPERVTLDVPVGARLYLAVWEDPNSISGVIGEFDGPAGHTLTGVGWQVCAIGEPYDVNGPGPTPERIQSAIDDCDAGQNVASGGWVDTTGAVTPGATGKLFVGEQNDSDAGTWPTVCATEMPVTPRWMCWDPMNGGADFDNTGDRMQPFQLFRAPPL